tara:strand:+ start:360 stop:911 length:552 start_codon:yes stop_codon:yes gene_type:complete
MTSKLKVNIIADGGDNAIMTSDGSGSLTINNAALKNTPAFAARLSADTTISNETNTKIDFDEEIFDTDSAYDHSTNQRFTVPSGKAGKYFFSIVVHLNSGGAARLQNCQIYIYKNGSSALEQNFNFNSNDIFQAGMSIAGTFDLSAGDYIEGYARMSNGSGTPSIEGANDTDSMFTGYRLIGA